MNVFYDLRITIEQEAYDPLTYNAHIPEKHRDRMLTSPMRLALSVIEDYLSPTDKLIAGFEVKGKQGEFVKPHFHLRFTSSTKKDTIRKQLIKRFDDESDIHLSGNKVWKFTIVPYINDERRYWAYVLKQQTLDRPHWFKTIGFEQDTVKEMMIEGAAVWKTACEVNTAKANKREEVDTLYDRLERKLDKGQGTLEEIIEFYVEESRPINDTTLVGYYNLYRLKRQRMSKEDYAAQLKSKYNISS